MKINENAGEISDTDWPSSHTPILVKIIIVVIFI